MPEEQQQQQPKRRRPPPKRGRPGLKRPRTVFHLDDVTTMAPPEEAIEPEARNDSKSDVNVALTSNVSAGKESSIPPHTAVPENQLLQGEKQAENTTNRVRSDSESNESAIETNNDIDLDGNTNQSGPWWTWAENQHALEGYVMAKLDKMITKSERDEERRIMNHFDEDILMHQLLHNIEKKEAELRDVNSDERSNDDDDKATAGMHEDPSVEENKASQISPEPEHPDEVPSIARPETMTEGMFEDATNDPSDTTVFQRVLPKWVPNRPGDNGTKSRLFTPQEFDSYVIQPLIHKLPCTIDLLEHCPNDENSYLIKARISNKRVDENCSKAFETRNRYWDDIKATVEAFLRSRISGVNLRWLLEDGASFELDLSLKVNEPMGVRFSRYTLVQGESAAITENANQAKACPPGLWINRIEPDKGIARALGNYEAFSCGCAMLSLNGTTVQDPLVLRKLIQSAKASAPDKPLSVKICLSKYADLSAIPLSKLTQKYCLKRRDGKPIHFESHQEPENTKDTTTKTPESPLASSEPTTLVHSSSGDKAQPSNSAKKSPSPRTLKNVVHPSFPQHLQAPGLSGPSVGEGSDKNETKQVSKELVHPSFRKSLERSNEKSNVLVRESAPTDNTAPNSSEAKDTPTKPTSLQDDTPGKSSDMSRSDESDQNSPAKVNSDARSGDKSHQASTTIQKGTQGDQQTNNEHGVSNSNDVEANASAIPRKSVALNNSESKGTTDKATATPASNGYIVDPNAVQHRVNTGSATKAPADNNEEGGKEPLQRPLGDDVGTMVNKDALVRKSSMTDDGISDLSDDEEDKGMSTTLEDGEKKKDSFPTSSQHNAPVDRPVLSRHEKQDATLYLDHFEVTLSTNTPLGGYFRTERGQNFQSKCVIFSITPCGPLHVNWGAKIRVGTQITAVMVGERRIAVHNHATVRDRYEYAKQHRQNLRLILQNNHSCKEENPSVSNANWSHNWTWIGKINDGWAGGALEGNNQFRDGAKTPRDRNGVPKPASGDVRPSLSNWENVTPNEVRQSEKSDGSYSPRVGRFSPTENIREPSSFDKPINDIERRSNLVPFPGEEAFLDAVHTKHWFDLMRVIENGPNLSKEFVQQVVKKQYRFIDGELKKANTGSSHDQANKFRMTMVERLEHDRKRLFTQDLQIKKKLLKIYIHGIYLVEKAMTLRNWDEVTIQIQNLELFHLPSLHDPERSKAISMKVQWTSPDIDLCKLPAAAIHHRISYSSMNEFSVRNNQRAHLENREVVVRVSAGDPEVDKKIPIELGQFVLAMDAIESKCSSHGEWAYREKLSDGFGKIGLRMKRKAADNSYCGRKREEILTMIKEQIETVERFNSEYCNTNSSPKLTPNLRGLYGISLLYASVEIMADERLIQKMVAMGANPWGTREHSPVDLARNQYRRCMAKERNSNQGHRLASANKTAQAKRVLDALQAAM